MKKVMIGLLVLVLIVGAVLWGLFSNLDSIVKKVIEGVGSEVTQTSVAVNDINLELMDGKAAVSRLSVANPAGFPSPSIFTLGGIAVDIDVNSLGSNPVIINEIRVSQPKVFYEINKQGASNLDILKKNVENYSASKSPSSGEKKAEEPAQGEAQAIKLIIRKVNFDGGELSASSALTPDKKIDTKLPAFTLSGIGESSGGATGNQIAKEVMDELIAQAIKAASKAGVDKLKGELEEKGREALEENLGGALKGVLGK